MKHVRIGDLVEVVGGGTPRRWEPTYYGGHFPWVTPKDMKQPVIGSSSVTLSAAGIANSPAKLIPAGSTLVVVRSGVLKHTLPVAITTSEVTVNQDMKALIPRLDLVEPTYLARLVKAQESHLLKAVRATTADNFPIEALLSIRLTLPPLPKQRRIAAILDEADALRQARSATVTYLAELPLARFQAYDQTEWRRSTVGDIADLQGGLTLNARRASLPASAGYLRVANVYRGSIDLGNVKELGVTEPELARTRLKLGDVLVVEGHGNVDEVGRAAMVEVLPNAPLTHQNHLFRLRPKPDLVTGRFLELAINAPAGREHLRRVANTTSGLNTLNATTVRGLPIRVAPLEIQKEIGADFAAAADSLQRARQSERTLDALFESLQHRAFRGEL